MAASHTGRRGSQFDQFSGSQETSASSVFLLLSLSICSRHVDGVTETASCGSPCCAIITCFKGSCVFFLLSSWLWGEKGISIPAYPGASEWWDGYLLLSSLAWAQFGRTYATKKEILGIIGCRQAQSSSSGIAGFCSTLGMRPSFLCCKLYLSVSLVPLGSKTQVNKCDLAHRSQNYFIDPWEEIALCFSRSHSSV